MSSKDDASWNEDDADPFAGTSHRLRKTLKKEHALFVALEFVTAVDPLPASAPEEWEQLEWSLAEAPRAKLGDILHEALRPRKPRFRGADRGDFLDMTEEYPSFYADALEREDIGVSPPQSSIAAVLHANLEAPTAVQAGRTFTVTASLTRAALERAVSHELTPIDLPPEGRWLTLRMHSPDGLVFVGDTVISVCVLPDQDCAPVAFDCRIDVKGAATAVLQVSDETLTAGHLGQVDITIQCVEATAASQQTQCKPSRPMAVRLEDLPRFGKEVSLEVQRVGPSTFAFRANGPRKLQKRELGEATYQSPIDEMAADIRYKLDALAHRDGSLGNKSHDILHQVGVAIWNAILPGSAREFLQEHLNELQCIRVYCDNLDIPWEVLAVPRVTQMALEWGSPFVADRVLITRWGFSLPGAVETLTLASPVFVVPDNAPGHARRELAELRCMFSQNRHVRTFAELQALLRKPDFDVLHFAAHHQSGGTFRKGGGAAIVLDANFDQYAFEADADSAVMMERTPLVFVNACGSAGSVSSWTASPGWAGAFLSAGASVFIGNLWTLRDEPARQFALTFYRELLDHSNLGAAFQAAQRAVRDPHNDDDATWLSYSLFGLATARIAEDASA